MKQLIIYCLAALVLTVTACKKDKDATPSTDVMGTWQVASNSLSSLSYYHFTNDNYLYILRRDDNGYKSISKGLYQFSNGQLIISFPSSSFGGYISNSLFNVEESGDSLYLTTGGSGKGDNIILLKDNLAPKQVADFIAPIQPISMFEDTAKAKSITYYGGKLYGVKGGDKVFLYGINEKRVTDVKTMVDSYDALEFDYAGNLWGTSYSNRFYALDLTTGNRVFSSAQSTNGYFRTLAFTGAFFVAVSTANGNFYNFYEPSNAFEYNATGSYDIDELGFGQNHGFAIKDGAIHKLSGNFDDYLQAYYIEGYNCKSIAYDNNLDKFWVGAESISDGKYYMLQVNLN